MNAVSIREAMGSAATASADGNAIPSISLARESILKISLHEFTLIEPSISYIMKRQCHNSSKSLAWIHIGKSQLKSLWIATKTKKVTSFHYDFDRSDFPPYIQTYTKSSGHLLRYSCHVFII
jgi:hypothetical protein